MEDSHKKSVRLQQLHKMFNERPRGYRTGELAKSLGVSERTIERDLEDLQAHPWYLPLVREESWYWRLDSRKAIALPPVSLVRDEAAALFLGTRLLRQHSGRLATIADAAVLKLAQALPTEVGNFLLLPVRGGIGAVEGELSGKEKVAVENFQALVTGWIERRKVVCVHQTPGGRIKSYRLAPYTFETSAVGHAVYVRGRCDEDREELAFRTLKLDRIQKVVLTEDRFQYEKAFSDVELAKAWRVWGSEDEPVEIRLRFNRRVVERVKESMWHPSQQLVDLPDGGCEWVAVIAEPKEMLPWIRGWGADCEVIAPEEVRQLLVAETERLMRVYRETLAIGITDDRQKAGTTRQEVVQQGTGSGYYAHSANRQGERHDLVAHLEGVANKAAVFARSFGASELAYYSGLWHDLGKFNPAWQNYLLECEKGNKSGKKIDHKAAGSLVMKQQGMDLLALLIQGHHGGLQTPQDFKDWFDQRNADPATSATLETARQLMPGLLPEQKLIFPDRLTGKDKELATEFFLRMLFSALIDADRLDTEAHGSEEKAALRENRVEVKALWQKLEEAQLTMFGRVAPTTLNRDRRLIYEACLAAAELPQGMFRLTVPTGGGKTRSGLTFALGHARKHNLQRVIVALPFTTITEQTADVYRAIFEGDTGGTEFQPVVLEHHSAYTDRIEDDKEGDFRPAQTWHRLASENWDAPIVVTTTVQLLESLFSNHTSKCRKLHRLANSVIILDEAQTLPSHLLRPILSGLRELSANYGTTIVFSTATQPVFETIPELKDLPATEIVSDPARFFESLKRVEYDWRIEQPMEWREVAELMRNERQALAVVNTKKDALALCEELAEQKPLYLSTNLCGAHRRQVVREIKRRLKAGEACQVVSTQLIEAGVDLDFPVVLRALAPVDSLIQAAGRCNREGKVARGQVIIFDPKEGGTASKEYRGATNLSRVIHGAGYSDLNDPRSSTEYFKRLYQQVNLDLKEINKSRKSFNYPKVAADFRMIREDTESVVVKFGTLEEQAEVEVVLRELKAGSPVARYLIRKLQPYTVSVYRNKVSEYTKTGFIEPVVAGLGEWQGKYDEQYGMVVQDLDPEMYIVG